MNMANDHHRDFRGQRVLVVEDERLLALDVQDILESWGCTVLGPVATVRAALRLIRDAEPTFAILDVNLVGETSEPIAAALIERGRSFLLLSAAQDAHLTGALSGAPLLNKPVDEVRLRRQLTAWLPVF